MPKIDEGRNARSAGRGTRRREPGAGPDPIDIHVGSRVRLRRTLMGLSQAALARSLGLTFQQIQKYEKGYNRIGSSRLFQIAQILEAPVSYFFEAMSGGPGAEFAVAETHEFYDADPMAKRETLELVRAYYRIGDPAVRRRVFDLMKAIGRTAPGGAESEDG
ncbi:MAG: helix-turn-helix transcriptional regulator [Alphaproteobacteria bacterium]